MYAYICINISGLYRNHKHILCKVSAKHKFVAQKAPHNNLMKVLRNRFPVSDL